MDPVLCCCCPDPHLFDRASLQVALMRNGGVCPASKHASVPLSIEDCISDEATSMAIVEFNINAASIAMKSRNSANGCVDSTADDDLYAGLDI